jgi:putative ABC transport system permease protein
LAYEKGYSLLNIAGLAIGLACCILILLYLQNERNFDAFHNESDRIYRIVEVRKTPDQGEKMVAQTVAPMGPRLVEDFPEVTAQVRLIQLWRLTVSHGEKRFYEGDYLFTEPSFFDVFNFEMEEGDPRTALNAPRSVVLTRKAAEKYFGNEDPLGKTLKVEALGDVLVTGVLADIPQNLHLDFSMLFSFASLDNFSWWKPYLTNWDPNYRTMITYVLLGGDGAAGDLTGKLDGFLPKYGSTADQPVRSIYLQPLRKIHFYSEGIEFDRNARKGDIAYVYIFSAIAAFIMLIACLNYMNLATARAAGRTKKVGVRKVCGANRRNLIFQFMGESVVITFIALLLATLLVELFLPWFNRMSGTTLRLNPLGNMPFLTGILILMLLAGIFAGSYPALFLSRINANRIFKGVSRSGTGKSKMRQVLVVIQFSLSVILLIATLVVYNQLDYIRNKKLGFNQEHLIAIDINNNNVREKFESMKVEMLCDPAVRGVTVSSRIPGDWKTINEVEVIPEGSGKESTHTMYFLGVDRDFLSAYQITLLEGQNFSDNAGVDSTMVLLNETAVRMLGWKSPIGKELTVPQAEMEGGGKAKISYRVRVAGVVKDFNFRSLHEKIAPMILCYRNNPIQPIDYFTVRVSGADMSGTIDFLREIGERFDPTHPFEYNFLDERLNNFYRSEQRLGRIVRFSAFLAITIAAMGLFGLVAYVTEQRTKEIGIRKVLGASFPNILFLLGKEFCLLILVASAIAFPLGWIIMSRWLQDFAYRIKPGISIFLAAGIITILITLLTISYQAIRAAIRNPVESLRYE